MNLCIWLWWAAALGLPCTWALPLIADSTSDPDSLNEYDAANLTQNYSDSNFTVDGSDSDGGSKLPFGGPRIGHGELKCAVCAHPHCDPGPDQIVHVCENATSCYTSHVRTNDGEERRSRGCVLQATDHAFYCSVASYDGENAHQEAAESAQSASECCKDEDMCNQDTGWPVLPAVPGMNNSVVSADDSANSGIQPMGLVLAIVLPIVAIVIVVVIVVVLYVRRNHSKNMAAAQQEEQQQAPGVQELHSMLSGQPVGDSTLGEQGAGSLAREIQLSHCINNGRFGEVWCGNLNDDSVAVKIFSSHDEDSFRREAAIYAMLRHDNVLGFIGHDSIYVNSCTQFWLVTPFCWLGSLFDFMERAGIRIGVLLSHKFILGVASGLDYLHNEVHGTHVKPGLAHRDLKTRNIIVSNNLNCLIADFELAVTHQPNTDKLSVPDGTRVGTPRYMSPEVLDNSIRRSSTFEAFKRSDIYSLAIVMWEVLRRTDLPDSLAEPFRLPYYPLVRPDPSMKEMRKVVCVKKIRPEVSPRLEAHKVTSEMSRIMKVCWSSDPHARLGALRVKELIHELLPDVEISSNKPATSTDSGS